MGIVADRRNTMLFLGAASSLGLTAIVGGSTRAEATVEATLVPAGASTLQDLAARLAKAPRRRDFKVAPMILTQPGEWDHEALNEVIAYRGTGRQVWDNTELGGPWLNLMRNSLNAQIWSFKHPDFLSVSATHGSAHLALYDEPAWEKYKLAALAGDKFKTNNLIVDKPAAASAATDYQSEKGAYSPENNTIPALQRRGVVFLACHNAIWEVAGRLIATGSNPDHLSHDALAADLTNHLAEGIVLTPGAVATIPELQAAGFHYAK